MTTKPKGPGAPTGNTNAAKPEKERAVPIHITVPPSLFHWVKQFQHDNDYKSLSHTVTDLLLLIQRQMK